MPLEIKYWSLPIRTLAYLNSRAYSKYSTALQHDHFLHSNVKYLKIRITSSAEVYFHNFCSTNAQSQQIFNGVAEHYFNPIVILAYIWLPWIRNQENVFEPL